jgi:hypothetical protein
MTVQQTRSRLAVRGTVLGAAVGIAALMGSPAQAVVVTHGYVTSSAYLSRGETRWIAQHLNSGSAAGRGTAFVVAGACAKVGKLHWAAGLACGASAVVYGTAFVNATNTAVRKNRCLRIRFTHGQTPVIVGLYDDGGTHCKN